MSNGNGGQLSRVQWGAILTGLGMLSGIAGFLFNAHGTLQDTAREVAEVRKNGLVVIERLETDVQTNQANVARIERRLDETQNYLRRLVDEVDERGDLIMDLMQKVDPALAAQYQRQRQRRREQVIPPRER